MLLALTPDSAGASTTSARTILAAGERAVYEAIARGDERQAAQVHARLLPAVQGTLRRVLGCPYRHHDELAQRSMERLIRELAQHSKPWVASLDSWAMTIAARVAIEVLQARALSREVSSSDAMVQSPEDDRRAASPGSASDRLRWLLAELPPQQAEAVVLCDVMGLSASDVAAPLGVGVDHVRRLLAAGHQRLALQLRVSGAAAPA